jgi:hypothetical protein
MNTTQNTIEEQRWAMLEMRIILTHIQNTYGANPPADILNAIAEVAKANRTRSQTHNRKLNHTVGIEEFHTNNNLSLG